MRKNIKKLTALLAAAMLLAALLLGGCTAITGGAAPSPSPKSAPREAVARLQCAVPGSFPNMLYMGGMKAYISWQDFEDEKTVLAVADIENDSIIKSVTIEGCWDLADQRFADGGAALYCAEKSEWTFVSAALDTQGAFRADSIYGYFSHDRAKYYTVKDSLLFATDTATGKCERVILPCDLRIYDLLGMHPSLDTLLMRFMLSDYESTCGTAMYDLAAGQFTMLNDRALQPHISASSMSFFEHREGTAGESVLYGSAEEGFKYADAAGFRGDGCELVAVGGSCYVADVGEDTVLRRIGEGLEACPLAPYGIAGELRAVCWLEDEQLILGGVWNESQFDMYILNPSALAFEPAGTADNADTPFAVDTGLADRYWEELAGEALGADLQEVRAQADKIEDKYGVRILLSSQCRKAADQADMEMKLSGEIGFADEAAHIGAFLKELDATLALYPEGFLAQFKNAVGDGGLRFLPVGTMTSECGAVGLEFNNSSWYNIAMDISLDSFRSAICHELWHATEEKTISCDNALFDWEEWAKCNPDGFTYYNDTNVTAPDQDEWTFFSAGDEGVYFVDGYSRANEKEDRARIMEYIMTMDEYAKDLVKSPAIKTKLKIMCGAVRKCFDTSAWGEVRWERFF